MWKLRWRVRRRARLVRLWCGAIVAGFEVGKCGRGVECEISSYKLMNGWRRLEWNGMAWRAAS